MGNCGIVGMRRRSVNDKESEVAEETEVTDVFWFNAEPQSLGPLGYIGSVGYLLLPPIATMNRTTLMNRLNASR